MIARRPSSPATSPTWSRRRAFREEPGRDVGHALTDEIAGCVRILPIGVGDARRDRRALHEPDEGERDRRNDQCRDEAEVRQDRAREAARDARRCRSRWRPVPSPATAAAADVSPTATTRPSGPRRVRSRIRIRTIVATPMTTVAGSQSAGWSAVSTARVTRLDPTAAYPVKSASCPRMMLTPTALMNPTITAFETKRSSSPSRSSAGNDHERARDHGQREERTVGIGAAVHGIDVGDHDRHRTGRLDRHERRARGQRPGERAHEVGVQAVHRVDGGEQTAGEAVGHALDPERDARNGVGTEGPRLESSPRSDAGQRFAHRRAKAAGSRSPGVITPPWRRVICSATGRGHLRLGVLDREIERLGPRSHGPRRRRA